MLNASLIAWISCSLGIIFVSFFILFFHKEGLHQLVQICAWSHLASIAAQPISMGLISLWIVNSKAYWKWIGVVIIVTDTFLILLSLYFSIIQVIAYGNLALETYFLVTFNFTHVGATLTWIHNQTCDEEGDGEDRISSLRTFIN
jgi:hypothetical protein